MRRVRILVVLFGLAALSACTPMRWDHPFIDPAARAHDSAHCRQSAYLEAQQELFFSQWWHRPVAVRGRDGRIYYVRDPYSWHHHDSFFQEQRLFEFCMRAKGYRLVPIR